MFEFAYFVLLMYCSELIKLFNFKISSKESRDDKRVTERDVVNSSRLLLQNRYKK